MVVAKGVTISESEPILDDLDTEIAISDWIPDDPYLDSLKGVTDENLYDTYLKLSKEYGQQPSFYLIVAYYFLQKNQQEYWKIMNF